MNSTEGSNADNSRDSSRLDAVDELIARHRLPILLIPTKLTKKYDKEFRNRVLSKAALLKTLCKNDKYLDADSFDELVSVVSKVNGYLAWREVYTLIHKKCRTIFRWFCLFILPFLITWKFGAESYNLEWTDIYFLTPIILVLAFHVFMDMIYRENPFIVFMFCFVTFIYFSMLLILGGSTVDTTINGAPKIVLASGNYVVLAIAFIYVSIAVATFSNHVRKYVLAKYGTNALASNIIAIVAGIIIVMVTFYDNLFGIYNFRVAVIVGLVSVILWFYYLIISPVINSILGATFFSHRIVYTERELAIENLIHALICLENTEKAIDEKDKRRYLKGCSRNIEIAGSILENEWIDRELTLSKFSETKLTNYLSNKARNIQGIAIDCLVRAPHGYSDIKRRLCTTITSFYERDLELIESHEVSSEEFKQQNGYKTFGNILVLVVPLILIVLAISESVGVETGLRKILFNEPDDDALTVSVYVLGWVAITALTSLDKNIKSKVDLFGALKKL